MAKAAKLPEKIVPAENCIRFWEALLFHDKAFLPVETALIIEATIKHLKGETG